MRRFGNNLAKIRAKRSNIPTECSSKSFKFHSRSLLARDVFKRRLQDASLAIVKIWTWAFLDQHAAQSVGCEEESKNIYFCIKSKRKVRRDTLKVQGVYLRIGLAWLCLWGSPCSEIGIHILSLSPEIGEGLHTYIHWWFSRRSRPGLEFFCSYKSVVLVTLFKLHPALSRSTNSSIYISDGKGLSCLKDPPTWLCAIQKWKQKIWSEVWSFSLKAWTFPVKVEINLGGKLRSFHFKFRILVPRT